jgi:hypothetical protein
MRPVDFFAEIGNIMTLVVKRPYRDEPLTDEELDSITDQILILAEKEKSNGNRTVTRTITRSV